MLTLVKGLAQQDTQLTCSKGCRHALLKLPSQDDRASPCWSNDRPLSCLHCYLQGYDAPVVTAGSSWPDHCQGTSTFYTAHTCHRYVASMPLLRSVLPNLPPPAPYLGSRQHEAGDQCIILNQLIYQGEACTVGDRVQAGEAGQVWRVKRGACCWL
jgi:hypothetical protein